MIFNGTYEASTKLCSGIAIFIWLVVGCSSNGSPSQQLPTVQHVESEIILQVALPEGFENDTIFDEFEREHPNVNVIAVNLPTPGGQYTTTLDTSLSQHLSGARSYAHSADVLFINSHNFSLESTRADLFANLDAFIDVDEGLNVEDYYPTIWNAFQWDGGTWALPLSASTILIGYQPELFDEVGLDYPSGEWDIDYLENAVQVLSKSLPDGSIRPALVTTDFDGVLLRSLLEEGLYTTDTVLREPNLNRLETAQMIQRWRSLQEQGFVAQYPSDYLYDDIPMIVTFASSVAITNQDGQRQWDGSLLPNGTAGLVVNGFAVSAGTDHPDLSYELVKYLISNDYLDAFIGGDTPAILNQPLSRNDDEETPVNMTRRMTQNIRPLIEEAISDALSPSDLMFVGYLSIAANDTDTDALIALEDAEQQINDILYEAIQTSREFSVDTSRMPATVQPGEITLVFGGRLSDIANRRDFRVLVDEFVQQDSQVGSIEIREDETFVQNYIEDVDCFFEPSSALNQIPSQMLLNLQPLISADSNFNSDTVFDNVLSQVSTDDGIYGYPIVIYPSVLWYNEQLSSLLGVNTPAFNWDINSFQERIFTLDDSSTMDTPIFVSPPPRGNTHLLMLMAAYGGVPYDYRTSPPTINIDTSTIDVVRQVLNLARDNYIYYPGENNERDLTQPPITETLIYSDIVSAFTFSVQFGLNESLIVDDMPFRIVNYPRGQEFVPVSFSTGAAYISAVTPHREACYRWISHISQFPHLFYGLPANSELINETLTLQVGEKAAEFYDMYSTVLNDPASIFFPPQSINIGQLDKMVEQIWLDQAFNSYLLDDGDLVTSLQHFAENIETFRACTTNIDAQSLDGSEYLELTLECAVDIDEDMEDRFAFSDN